MICKYNTSRTLDCCLLFSCPLSTAFPVRTALLNRRSRSIDPLFTPQCSPAVQVFHVVRLVYRPLRCARFAHGFQPVRLVLQPRCVSFLWLFSRSTRYPFCCALPFRALYAFRLFSSGTSVFDKHLCSLAIIRANFHTRAWIEQFVMCFVCM